MPRPNILVFLTDDHGQWASSAYGNRELHTPAMQWLADTGARMERAFTPLPVCSPARASFFTGRMPSAHGLHDWLQEPGENKDHPGLEGQATVAMWLQEAGYRTGLTGKWHCGKFWKKQPGWDTWFTSARGTNARFGGQTYYENEQKVEFFGHQHTIVTDRAVRFLRDWKAAQDTSPQPFFLFVGYTNTHTPHVGEPEQIAAQYRQATFADIPDEKYGGQHGHAYIAPFHRDDPTRREQLVQYYAAVHVIDQQMSRLFQELEDAGQLDNTLIVYTSDHGHMNGHHGLHTKANATIPHNFLDESILVPALLRWPGRIPNGQSFRQPVDHCDLWATLIEAAGLDAAAISQTVGSPGRSYLPLLNGQASDWRNYQICEYTYSRMIRTETAKLIRRYPNRVTRWPDEFYDLARDPRENRNAIDDPAHAPTIETLDRILSDFFQRYADPARDGTVMANLYSCNTRDTWTMRPGEGDHRQ